MNKMKKLLICAIVFLIIISFLLAACKIGNGSRIGEDNYEVNDNGNEPDFKIVILTSFINDDEEAYYSAEKAVEMYGSDRIIHKSTPEHFNEEGWFNTFCSELLEDTTVKVLIINPAIEHLTGMFEKIRVTFPDILIVTTRAYGVDNIFEFTDIVIAVDDLSISRAIPEHAKKLGAKNIIFYSLTRHMDVPILAQQRDLMEETCMDIGLEFVYTEAIDPMFDDDIADAQQFILRDVPRKVEEFSKDTCFFTTNGYLQKSLISSALEQGVIVAPYCYNPYYGFPEILGIEFDDENFWDVKWLNQQIANIIAEYGVSDRFFSWPVPDSMLIGSAAVEYGLAYCEGLVGRQADKDMLVQCLQKAMEDFGYKDIGVYVNLVDGTDNYFLFTEDYITY